ncbi:TonB-dependent receptor [Variovorax sp. YR752]|uniref:TonB-dependent siderophore receptor n=1 Tax=Variovorax sp. YR752 TaxID=1884383 RepID=UPI003137A1D8
MPTARIVWTCAAVVLAGLASSAARSAETEDRPGPPAARDVADMDISELVNVRVSPFDVSSHLDRGYRASNAVSASRFDAPVRDLPFAIQAFTGPFIRDQSPRDIHDIARYSPGVTYRSNDFNEGNANLAIRGFTVSAVPGGTQILRDGYVGPSFFDFTNIARVEVVKGPSSFLYGQVAPGGIVNIITKSPQARFEATGEAGFGSYGQYRARADVTGPASSTLRYRLAASHDQDIHYWDPYDAHSRNFSPALSWQPSERVNVSLRYENFRKLEAPQLMQKPGYGRQRGVVPTPSDPNLSGVDVPGLPDTWNSMSDVDYRRSESEALNAWIDVEAGEHWHLRGGYAKQNYSTDMLFSGNLGMPDNTTFLQGRRLRAQVYINRDETLSVDAVGRYQLGAASLRVLLGAQHVRRRFDNWAAQAPNDPALGSDPIASPLPLWDLRDPSTWNRQVDIPRSALTENPADRRSEAHDQSVYAGSTLGLFDERLLLLAGWRLTTTRNTLDNRLTQQVDRIDARKGTPQLGVLYKIDPGLALFASYAESFVPGAAILNRVDGSTAAAEPSEGKGFDLGVKAVLLDGRVAGTLSIFDLRNRRIVNDLAQTNSAGAVEIFNLQSGEQRSRGVELDLTLTPAPRWQLYLSYSYMDARIVEVTGDDASVLAQDPATLDAAGQINYKNVSLLHGARLQMSAPHLANLWTRYDFAAGTLGGAYLGGGLNIVRDQTLLPDGPPSSRQSYTLVNLLAGYSWLADGSRMSVELAGKNLGGATYRPSQSTRARPREFLLTLRATL